MRHGARERLRQLDASSFPHGARGLQPERHQRRRQLRESSSGSPCVTRMRSASVKNAASVTGSSAGRPWRGQAPIARRLVHHRVRPRTSGWLSAYSLGRPQRRTRIVCDSPFRGVGMELGLHFRGSCAPSPSSRFCSSSPAAPRQRVPLKLTPSPALLLAPRLLSPSRTAGCVGKSPSSRRRPVPP